MVNKSYSNYIHDAVSREVENQRVFMGAETACCRQFSSWGQRL